MWGLIEGSPSWSPCRSRNVIVLPEYNDQALRRNQNVTPPGLAREAHTPHMKQGTEPFFQRGIYKNVPFD